MLLKASNPKPASAHWSLTFSHSSTVSQCNHRKTSQCLQV